MKLDAYDLARLDGFDGTRDEFIRKEYLSGGMHAAKAAGFTGTEDDLQSEIIGKAAPLNAFDLAVSYGFKGTAKDWLESLQGVDGLDVYQLAVKNGFAGTESEYLDSIKGLDGLDAYQLALSIGYDGSLTEFLASLKGDKGDKGEKGDDGDTPIPRFDGTSLLFEFQDGTSTRPVDLKGEAGDDGQDGRMPAHQWDGKRIRFEMPDGTWGEWVDLSASIAASTGGGGSLSLQKFYDSAANFPTTGKSQILYFDTSTTPYSIYVWDGFTYQQVGGGEGSGTAYTVAVAGKNTSGALIPKGTPVMATGTLGASGVITIAPMDGTNAENYKYLIGIAGADIDVDAIGDVVDIGKVRGFDTTDWSEGDVLWISTTEVGKLTNVEPVTGLKMPIAFVVTDHPQVGEIMVRITPIDENSFVQQSFETVAQNLKAVDATLSYISGDLTTIEYANGVTKTLAYSAGELISITLSGTTPMGIDLVKTLGYTSGDLTSVTYTAA